jgi:site-specific recombinase XerC
VVSNAVTPVGRRGLWVPPTGPAVSGLCAAADDWSISVHPFVGGAHVRSEELLDCLGRRRSPAATSAFHVGRPPRNRGLRYPADPPAVEEIVAVMRAAGPGAYGDRLRAIIVVLWRAGLRIGEALALAETDLDPARGAVLVRAGKGGKRREVGLDAWGWRTLDPWLEYRRQLPVGPLFCVLHGPSRGRPWSPAAVRRELRRAGTRAGVRRRLAPHQLRHAHAVEMAHEGSRW